MLNEEIISLNFDKTAWDLVKFGDVVREVRTSTKDPLADGLKFSIGLEHIESENIHIKAWNSVDGNSKFTRKFKKGQVLFGRRRAYLKKAALAEFDGICSGDIIVMEAKNGLRGDLLPFIVQSQKFFDFAIRNSDGSLSPRVKFKDLAKFEFLLPPKDQQAKIAELLWSADEALVSGEILNQFSQIFFRVKQKDIFKSIIGSRFKISQILVSQKDIHVGKLDQKDYHASGKFPIIDQSTKEICGFTDDEMLVYKGSLPVIIYGDHTNVLKFVNYPFVLGADGTKILMPKNDIEVKFLYYSLQSLGLRTESYRRHYSILKDKEIVIPQEPTLIQEIVDSLDAINHTIHKVSDYSHNLKMITKSIVNKVFNGN